MSAAIHLACVDGSIATIEGGEGVDHSGRYKGGDYGMARARPQLSYKLEERRSSKEA
ncbi:hypothetical protein FRC03_010864 [Tulasnella sp. 419]|nr:hypothetical protein FRC03_010864 [Tulasnella sp. 419]